MFPAKFSGIVSISADAIISIDEQRRISVFNQGAEEIFGYSAAEALGRPLSMLLPEGLRARHDQHIAAFAAGAAFFLIRALASGAVADDEAPKYRMLEDDGEERSS